MKTSVFRGDLTESSKSPASIANICLTMTKNLSKLLTNKVVNSRVVDDKKSCQIESSSKNKVKGDTAMPLYNQLKEYRSKLGINQTDLGKMAGVSRQTISLIERGDYSPSVTLALKLAKICEVKVEDIFQYEEDEP